MTGSRCKHPHSDRKKIRGSDQLHCQLCGKDFLPRGVKTRHGTVRGYYRHVSAKKGRWGWPACDKCMDAMRENRKERAKDPQVLESTRRRNRARLNALYALQHRYPGEYASLYARKLAELGGHPRPPRDIPGWDDIIARLVKEALGVDEASAVIKVRTRSATHRETETMRQVARLRTVLGQREQ